MARILSISSQVMRGRVGNSLTKPVLESLGHEVWDLPTVILSTRPGLGTIAAHEFSPRYMRNFAAALETDGMLAGVDGILTGYFYQCAI